MKQVGIIGASGYAGHELVKLLSKHDAINLAVINSVNHAGREIKCLYPDYQGGEVYTSYSIDEINQLGIDALFLALPHGHSMDISQKLDSKIKIIDLGADFRFKDMKKYEEVYNIKSLYEKNPAVYGLPELFKEQIRNAKIIANPGCYVTASILATYPVQEHAKYIVFDCKSGWSGAGKESSYAKDLSIIKDNIKPYNIVKHRHKYEIEQFIKTKLSFTPHVIDTFRGMMCTAHILLKKEIKEEEVINIYKEFYENAQFARIKENSPEIKDTQNTNYCDIGGFEIDENNQLVIISTIDNLLKGASGQAVQNMNIMLGFDEKEALV